MKLENKIKEYVANLNSKLSGLDDAKKNEVIKDFTDEATRYANWVCTESSPGGDFFLQYYQEHSKPIPEKVVDSIIAQELEGMVKRYEWDNSSNLKKIGRVGRILSYALPGGVFVNYTENAIEKKVKKSDALIIGFTSEVLRDFPWLLDYGIDFLNKTYTLGLNDSGSILPFFLSNTLGFVLAWSNYELIMEKLDNRIK